MALLRERDIARIQRQVAPSLNDPLCSILEFWEMPGDTVQNPIEGGAGKDKWGMATRQVVDDGRTDQALAQVATYPGRIGLGGRSAGSEMPFATQPTTVEGLYLTLNWADSPDIRGGQIAYEAKTEFVEGLLRRKAWTADMVYAEDDQVQPVASNGRYYACIEAGTTGSEEPEWPATEGDTVTDGTTQWMDMGPLRTFSVIDPANSGTYNVLRNVRVEELS